MRHLNNSRKQVRVALSQIKVRYSLPLLMFVISLSSFVSSSFAMLPPLRSIQITNQTSGGNINYVFKVFDEQRNQWIESQTGFWQSNKIIAPTATDGVVTWVVDINTSTISPAAHRLYYSVYDPKRGVWWTGYENVNGTDVYQSSSLKSKNGIVYWATISGTEFINYFFKVYNPNLGLWIGKETTHRSNSYNHVQAPILGDGVVAWHTSTSTPGSPSGEVRIWTLVYDSLDEFWAISDYPHPYSLATFTINSITNSTVYYTVNGVNYTRGYDTYGSFGWYNGLTIPISRFIPSQTVGDVPLKVYFWDMLIGGSSWNYNFGDGGTSNVQSPFYTYNSAVGTPYTATQTVSGPGGTKNSSVLITSTTPHSITGNIVNVNGFKVSGATVNLTGTLSKTTQTDSNGNYSFSNLTAGGSYTVSISKSRYNFAPSSRTFSNLSGNQAGSFTGKLNDKPSDFDGDAKTDISIFRPDTGNWWILNSSNNSAVATSFGLASDKLVPRDYDGDGKTDIAVWRPSEGNWYILQSSNNALRVVNFGSSGDIPVVNDYDGDDRADTAVFRPSNSTWYVLNSSNSQFSATAFGVSSDKPVSGDYDGDEKADWAVYRASNLTWYILQSSNLNVVSQQFGGSGDKLVQGDYDGDGKTDLAVFHSSDTTWRIKRSSDSIETSQSWGLNSDNLAPGDYDGDGKYDIGVFRSGAGAWFISKSLDQSLYAVTFGQNGDFPTVTSYISE